MIDVKPETGREEYGVGYLVLSAMGRKSPPEGKSDPSIKMKSNSTNKEGEISTRGNLLATGIEIEKNRCGKKASSSCSWYIKYEAENGKFLEPLVSKLVDSVGFQVVQSPEISD